MFGGRRSSVAAPAPAATAAAAPPPPPLAAPAAAPTSSGPPGFVVPQWCQLPRGATCSAQLLVWRGAALLETVPIGGRGFFIAGRLAESDIVLEHASASRHHAAVLHHRSGAVYLLDLGSAHGTFLSGRRLPPREPALWADGTPCVFGASSRVYVLRVDASASLVPPPADPVGTSMAPARLPPPSSRPPPSQQQQQRHHIQQQQQTSGTIAAASITDADVTAAAASGGQAEDTLEWDLFDEGAARPAMACMLAL